MSVELTMRSRRSSSLLRWYVEVAVLLVVFCGTPEAKQPEEAQNNTPVCTVVVVHTDDDSPGVSLALAVRERIKRSSVFRLVEKNPNLLILFQSVKFPGARHSGPVVSAVSVVLVAHFFDEFRYLGHKAMIVTSDVASVGAENIVAALDHDVNGKRDLYCTAASE